VVPRLPYGMGIAVVGLYAPRLARLAVEEGTIVPMHIKGDTLTVACGAGTCIGCLVDGGCQFVDDMIPYL
jgi:hypothetical protein